MGVVTRRGGMTRVRAGVLFVRRDRKHAPLVLHETFQLGVTGGCSGKLPSEREPGIIPKVLGR